MTSEEIVTRLRLCVPEWVYTLKEFENIYYALSPDVVEMRNRLEQLERNQYIFEADDEGLTKFEKMYELPTYADDDVRRVSLYNYYNSNCNFTIPWFENYMNNVVGKGAWMHTLANYELHITINDSKWFLYETLLADLRKKIPANIGLSIIRSESIDNTIYTAGIVHNFDKITI